MDNDNKELKSDDKFAEVHVALSKVSSNPKSSAAILAVVVLILGYFAYTLIFTGDTTPQKPTVPKPVVVVKPTEQTTDTRQQPEVKKAPDLPKLPDLKAPTPPAPSSPTTQEQSKHANANDATENTNTISVALPMSAQDVAAQKQRISAKRKSAIILVNGTPQAQTAEEISAKEDFKFRGDLSYVLGKGKIIEAVLETTINTNFGGEVRALISRDVFSESGKVVLIPKGSRVFGSYTQSIHDSYGRVEIAWSRVDIPSGYTINLVGDAVDNLGRKGTVGRLDNKYTEQITNSILVSAFNITLANILDKITPPPVTQNTAAANTAIANSINSTAMGIFSNVTITDPAQKILNICTQIPQLIPDKTSPMYTSVVSSCAQYQNSTTGSTPTQNLQALMTAINLASSQSSQSSAAALNPSQAQTASKAAFENIANITKGMIGSDNKPDITINQGEVIKIYVTKDYVFPSKLSVSTRILK